jgi:hypothetical protein
VLTLMHELIFFFTPHLVLMSFLQGHDDARPRRWWLSALVPAGSGCAIALLAVFSHSLSDPALCSRLTSAGAPEAVCRGVMSYGHESIAENTREFLGVLNGSAIRAVAGAAAFTLLPPVLLALMSAPTGRIAWLTVAGLFGAVVFSFPLFVLALDWGRWLAIHASLFTISCALLLPDRRLLPYRPAFTRRSVVSVAAGVMVLVAMFGWSVKHCCRTTLITPFGPIDRISDRLQEWNF